MRKHDSFRAAIVAAFPELATQRDRLAIYIDSGAIAARLTESSGPDGFEWRYTLTAILLDFAGDTNLLAKATLDWIANHQAELLLNHGTADRAISFRVDVLDSHKADVEIEFDLTEAVDIGANGQCDYREEPVLTEGFEGVPCDTALEAITGDGSVLLP